MAAIIYRNKSGYAGEAISNMFAYFKIDCVIKGKCGDISSKHFVGKNGVLRTFFANYYGSSAGGCKA